MSKPRIDRLAKRAEAIAEADQVERWKRLGLSEEDFARVAAFHTRIVGNLRAKKGREPEEMEVLDVLADELAAEAGVTREELILCAAKVAAAEHGGPGVVRVRVGPDKWEHCDAIEAKRYLATFDRQG